MQPHPSTGRNCSQHLAWGLAPAGAGVMGGPEAKSHTVDLRHLPLLLFVMVAEVGGAAGGCMACLLPSRGAAHALATADTGAPPPRRAGWGRLSQGCGIRDGGVCSASPEGPVVSSKMLPLLFEVCASKPRVLGREALGQRSLHQHVSPSGITFVTIHCQNEWRLHSRLY